MTIRKLLLTLLAVVGLTCIPKSHAIIVVGVGDDVSYAVIQADTFGTPIVFAYHYTYDSSNPFDAYFLFNEVAAALPELTLGWVNYGDDDEPNYFLQSVTYYSDTLISTAWPDVGPYWAQWVAGGESGFPFAVPIASGVWTYGDGMSSPYRLVQPGSWDGVIYNDGSVPPDLIPEPSTAWLLFSCGAVVCFLNRRKCSARLSA